MTIFGKSITADVISSKIRSLGQWAINQNDWCLYKKVEVWTQRQICIEGRQREKM